MLTRRCIEPGYNCSRIMKQFLRVRMSTAGQPEPTAAELDTVASNLRVVLDRLDVIAEKAQSTDKWRNRKPVLVAVSKLKHPQLIRRCYDEGHRKFGENYIQELAEKAVILKDECPEIEWHFIGQIQSNKVRDQSLSDFYLITLKMPIEFEIAKLASVPNLHYVETLSSEKHCALLNKEMSRHGRCLNVYVQANTSDEPQKGGATPDAAVELAKFVQSECSSLKLAGFMTIGSYEHSSSELPNTDFDVLFDIRKRFCERTGSSEGDFDLSMGMSHDFETAVLQGSTSVRVGSTIFGPRLKKN
ncbi:unnamed protein product [Anisakis simplex]|uniref:Pyridoxal phosphate homeostasis protein n=1 Tax=Anisakis simplex TaxID=6269 RepID=A0A0M3K7F2_ANISI|nr:unnamed protein product [Anisakis simplex]